MLCAHMTHTGLIEETDRIKRANIEAQNDNRELWKEITKNKLVRSTAYLSALSFFSFSLSLSLLALCSLDPQRLHSKRAERAPTDGDAQSSSKILVGVQKQSVGLSLCGPSEPMAHLRHKACVALSLSHTHTHYSALCSLLSLSLSHTHTTPIQNGIGQEN